MKVRVYEIAHEYGQSTRHVIDVLHRISAGVHSASTPLEPLVVARLRAELEGRRSAMRPSVVSDPMDDAAKIFGIPRSSLRPARGARPHTSRLRPADRPQRVLEAWETEWLVLLIDEVERDAWLAAGLGRHDAKFAARLSEYGIGPAMLSIPLDGRTAGARLRGGEPIGQIIARFRQTGQLGA